MANDVELAMDRIRLWRRDPVAFVRDNFGIEPDLWQVDALTAVGGDYDPKRRLCMKACTGPGKSATMAWIGWHRLACFAAPGEHPKGAALSITRDNLQDNLWAELSKWQSRSKFLSAAFTWTKTNIYANDHPETWFLSARSFAKDADSEAIGRALSGLHSQFPFVLLDESGDMPTAVGRAAAQIFTGSPQDAAIVQAGNPTSTSGLLYESCVKASAAWKVITITADPEDPARTPRVSVEHAQEMIDNYGRDNPWVMATILGKFPPAGFNSLLSIEEVEAAAKRHYKEGQLSGAAMVLGGDVARQGGDASVIIGRRGRQAYPPRVMRIPDAMMVAQEFIREKVRMEADAVFVDETGGYGAGVIDAMRQLNHHVMGVQFAGKANSYRYYNKRTEILFEMCEWIKSGGAIPDDPELKEELCALEYAFKGDQLIIVAKEIIKSKIGRSPDKADALALTFAAPVLPASRMASRPNSSNRLNYDPLKSL